MSFLRTLETARRSRFAAPAALLLGLAVLLTNEGGHHRALSVIGSREALLEARVEVSTLLREVTAAESMQRGYLLTGRTEYKDPFLRSETAVRTQLKRIETLYARWPERRNDVTKLEELTLQRLSELDTTVQMFEGARNGTWRDVVLFDIGHDTMLAIEHQARDMALAETTNIDLQRKQLTDALAFSRIGIAALVVLSLGALLMYARQTRRLDAERGERAAALRFERDRLENEVERRTREITQIATHLQTAREDERSMLARELHDELGGLLTAAKLDLARLRSRLVNTGADIGERMAHLVQTLDEGIALKRRIIEDLHPSSLNNLGLKAALEILCTEFAERSEIDVQTQIDELPLGDPGRLTVYRLVQEALTNVAKYANAAHVRVTVRAHEAHAEVEVADDGVGFDPAQASADAHGLAGMRFRVRSAQGELRIRSRRGRGTSIFARLPLQATAGAAPEPLPREADDAGADPESLVPHGAAEPGLP
ncbi:MAG TPA: CHASE3 domain-containing protein [Burkholderiaceae bacterium]|nr:CHASE3 domain-containing protein [Burkholderiaceae bacterium]